MNKKRVLIQALVALALVWAVVLGVRHFAGSKRVTAENIRETVEARPLDDWSDGRPAGAEAGDREKHINRVADMFNRLDFGEREEAREERIGEDFFRRLSPAEKERFVNLTVEESMENFMRALDAMSPEERRRFVEEGLREIENGRTEEEMRRARELSEDMLARVTEEGMEAYFEKTSADTKLDLAPLMEAMDEEVKGLRGHNFGPPQQ